MSDNPEALAGRMEKEGRKTLEFFRQIEPAQWGEKVYSEGASWSVLQIFTHIVEVEDSIPRLIANILGGGSGVSEDFDIDRYNESKVAKIGQPAPGDLLRQFEARRTETVALARRMKPEDLETEGRHPFLGVAPVGEMLKLMYLHIQIHQRDVRRVLKAA